jgi:hypothetical protein
MDKPRWKLCCFVVSRDKEKERWKQRPFYQGSTKAICVSTCHVYQITKSHFKSFSGTVLSTVHTSFKSEFANNLCECTTRGKGCDCVCELIQFNKVNVLGGTLPHRFPPPPNTSPRFFFLMLLTLKYQRNAKKYCNSRWKQHSCVLL